MDDEAEKKRLRMIKDISRRLEEICEKYGFILVPTDKTGCSVSMPIRPSKNYDSNKK